MKSLKCLLSLLLCLCMAASLVVIPAGAADYVNTITVSVYTPAAGFKPQDATTSETASCEVRDTQWSGDFDANGCFISGKTYTITVTLGMKDDVDRYFKQSDKASSYTINGKNAEVVSHSKTKVVLRGAITAAAGLYVSSGHASVAEPVVGAKPADAVITQGQGVKVDKTEWIGELNNGTFKEGVSYTVRCTLVPSMSTSRLKLEEGEKVTINGQVATVISASSTEVVTEFKFAPTTKAVAAVADNGVLRKAQFYYNKPMVGDKPSRHIAVVQSDALYITDIKWSGDFDENGRFMAKKTYQLEFVVRVRDGINMTIPENSNINVREYRLNDSLLTVNTGYSSTGKAIRFNTNVYIDLPHDLVDIAELYTLEQADALENTRNGKKYRDLILNNEVMANLIQKHRLNTALAPVDAALYLDIPEVTYATRLLVDYPADHEGYDGSSGKALDLLPNITELWLSPDMNVKGWLTKMQERTPFGYEGLDLGPNCWSNFTVYISSEKYPNGWMDQYVAAYLYPFRIQIYDGDVYTAFEKAGKGEQVGRDWCFNHEYTLTAARPDCVMKYATCQNATWYCYSCEHCGKPEFNINHIFKTIHNSDVKGDDVTGRIEHSMTKVIDAKHLMGKNADGDLVYAETCIWCGYNEKQITLMEDFTQAQFNYLYGDHGASLKEYRALLKESWDKSILSQVLASTAESPMVGYFVVDADKVVTAKTATWATGEVNWAAQNDLLDVALLGNDYTKNITRLQFCSLAVKLAEEMLGREITPAPSTFTDTDNVYVLKAVAAGITTGTSATTFSPNSTLTREQMATFIYRALMYVRNNSDIRYTVYDSKLAEYTDGKNISSWATDSLAFLNALGIIKGKTTTTLVPKGTCTIQEAILVAYRSLSADKIGWYQAYQWFWDGDLYYLIPESLMDFSKLSFGIGDRVWATGVVGDYEGWLVVESPDIDRTNTTMYLNISDFKPIKDLKADDAERYYAYVPQ